MIRRGLLILPFCAAHLFSAALCAQPPPSGIYEIRFGHYSECCGFGAGMLEYVLPYERQAYLKLIVDGNRNVASLQILGADMQTTFRPIWGGPLFAFTNGVIIQNRLEFWGGFNSLQPRLPGYTVTYTNGFVELDGRLHSGICCDIPSDYTHTDVTARLLFHTPLLTVQTTRSLSNNIAPPILICWERLANHTYQLQYLSPTNTWLNLGSPLTGYSIFRCVAHDSRLAPARIYRVMVSPR